MKIRLIALTAALLAGTSLALPANGKTGPDKTDAEIIAAQLPSYPLEMCLVSDEPLTAMGEPLDYVHEGRLVRFCCKGCVKQFKKDPAPVLAKIDAAVIAAQLPSYPLETCVISEEPLDAMGKPLDVVYGTRLVRLCCKGCKKALAKKPEEALAKVNAALIAAQLESYPLTTCIISGEEIEGEGENMLYGTRLVRFCCPMCVKKFGEEPQKHLAKLEVAKAEK